MREEEAARDGSGPGSSPALPAVLRRAGDRLMALARSGLATRDTAVTLLAADALMTYACEAEAQRQPEKLGQLDVR